MSKNLNVFKKYDIWGTFEVRRKKISSTGPGAQKCLLRFKNIFLSIINYIFLFWKAVSLVKNKCPG
ncbi:MAG: hypothetical protein KAW12_16015 [Candidatus Aminicenantes bacterium]|nr:hypothetical protein [Candidatus Aminicenantes bacterium]